MQTNTCSYQDIQTPKDVWSKLIEMHPIDQTEIFLEPFAGDRTLYDQITNTEKHHAEITEGKDIFDLDEEIKNKVTIIYTNPPFKTNIIYKNKLVYKNAVYYLLEYFMKEYRNLHKVAFLINAKSFTSLTPSRLSKLDRLGYQLTKLTILNTNYWYGVYYFVIFEKKQSSCVSYIAQTFTQKHNWIAFFRISQNNTRHTNN